MASSHSGQSHPAKNLAEVLDHIRDPLNWIDPDELIEVLRINPSLRGMVYGYVSEQRFAGTLGGRGIREHHKPDDHKKTKSDRTFTYGSKEYTIQLKSIQTNSVKEPSPGKFTAKIQNDASDRRKITLPNGKSIETTCYQVGEYDILGVSLQPFTGDWRFAFKKNRHLKTTTSKKYDPSTQKYLLATLEDMAYPLTDDWTEELASLLTDTKLGKKIPGR